MNARLRVVGWAGELVLAMALIAVVPAWGQPDAVAQQQQAVQALDGVIDRVRRGGNLQAEQGALGELDRRLEQVNAQLAARGPSRELALGLTKRGSVARLQGQGGRALQLYQAARQAAQRAGDAAQEADAMAWIAFAHFNERQFQQAAALTREALPLAERAGDAKVLANVLDVLVSALAAMGDLNGAAAMAEREVAAARASGDPMADYFALLNRSDIALKRAQQCDFRQAFEACQRAIEASRADMTRAREIVVRLGYDGLRAQTDSLLQGIDNRGALIASRDRAAQSVRAAKVFSPRRPEDVLVTGNFIPPGAHEAAPQMRALVAQLQRDAKAAGRLAADDDATLLYIEGQLAEMEQRHDDALAAYLKSIAALERDRRALRDERARNSFMENRITVYYAAVQQLLQRQRHAEAFDLLERSRSRVLAEMLAAQSPQLRGPAERALIAEAAQLRAAIAQTQAQLAEAPGARAEALSRKLREDDERHRAVLARIEREAPRLAGLVAERPASLAALQASMRAEGYEVLQYLVTDSALIVWHLTPDSAYGRNVFLPRTELIRKVAALRDSLANPAAPFDEATSGELFLYLVQPFLSRVRSERLVILPHEALNGLSFAALRQPQGGRFLGERLQISYAPSASVLLKLKRSAPLAGARVVAFGDPQLDAQGRELGAIQRLFAGKAKVHAGEVPPKAQLVESLAGFDVVHLALHGRYEASEPMRSHLLLPGAAGDAGRLTAAEMFGLPLDSARLVVLSACESGRAEATHANETLGMARGLLYAGAQSLLLSQWAVDSEATSAWMQAFYEVAQNRPVAEAVRVASMRVKDSPGRAHPFYWAAFTLLAR